MKDIEVVAAIIFNDGKILCTQRNASKHAYISYKYEFPGGKVEDGELKENALIREIKEELNIDVVVECEFLTVQHNYPDFSITMHSFLCHSITRALQLNEHIGFKWLAKDELATLDWAGADIPIVNKLLEAHKS